MNLTSVASSILQPFGGDAAPTPASSDGKVLLQGGGSLLTQTGGEVLLQGTASPAPSHVLLQGGGQVLLQGGGSLLLDGEPTPTVTIREAIAAWLAGLSGLSGYGVYFAVPPQKSAYPCLVIKIPSRSYGHNLYGADGTSRATVEITALALRQSQAVAAAETVRSYAQGFRGNQSGVAILRMLYLDEADDQTPPPDGSADWIYSATLEYRCDHRVPVPAFATQTNV